MIGFRAAIEMAGEARNPQRDIPLALAGSMLVTQAIYRLIQIGFVRALPMGSLGLVAGCGLLFIVIRRMVSPRETLDLSGVD